MEEPKVEEPIKSAEVEVKEREELLSKIVIVSGRVGAWTQELSRVQAQLDAEKENLAKLVEKAKADLIA